MSFKLMLGIYFWMSIIVVLAGFKIYLSNEIYYESRRINYIEKEVIALKEEQLVLWSQLEKQKFKNRVADATFVMEQLELELEQKGETP